MVTYRGWYQYPYSSRTAEVFTDIAKNRDFFAIKVPPAIVGLEHNIILNPLFKEFCRVEVVEFITLPVDERLKSADRV